MFFLNLFHPRFISNKATQWDLSVTHHAAISGRQRTTIKNKENYVVNVDVYISNILKTSINSIQWI